MRRSTAKRRRRSTQRTAVTPHLPRRCSRESADSSSARTTRRGPSSRRRRRIRRTARRLSCTSASSRCARERRPKPARSSSQPRRTLPSSERPLILARFARRDGRLVLSLLAESGWDSNVTLTPNGTPNGPPATDGVYALSGSVLFRPVGNEGPYVRLGGFLQNQLQLGAYDFDGFDAAGGWQFGRADWGVILEYDYGAREFGGAPYLSAHRLLGSGWLRSGRVLLGASYLVRFETYASAWSPFSGVLQRAEVRASLLTSRAVRLGLAYAGGRDAANENVLSFLEHGPRAELRIAVGRALLGADAAVTWRGYDAYDASLVAQRADTYLDAVAFAEWDLDGRLSLRFSVLGRRALSNVSAFQYDKLLPTIGIGYTLGLSP